MSKAVIVMHMQRAEWLIAFDSHFPRFIVQPPCLCHSFAALSLFPQRAEWLIAFVPHFPRFIVQSERLCHPFIALPLFIQRAEWVIAIISRLPPVFVSTKLPAWKLWLIAIVASWPLWCLISRKIDRSGKWIMFFYHISPSDSVRNRLTLQDRIWSLFCST